MLNPLAIIEILSKSTKNLDQTRKMEAYQSIETLIAYILIDQYKPYVVIHRRISANKWEQEYLTSMSSKVDLESIGYSLSLSEIYEGVVFETGL
ncbi:MAG: hypothetical protein OHK0057_01220 [Thermoflexibacter sp.]